MRIIVSDSMAFHTETVTGRIHPSDVCRQLRFLDHFFWCDKPEIMKAFFTPLVFIRLAQLIEEILAADLYLKCRAAKTFGRPHFKNYCVRPSALKTAGAVRHFREDDGFLNAIIRRFIFIFN